MIKKDKAGKNIRIPPVCCECWQMGGVFMVKGKAVLLRDRIGLFEAKRTKNGGSFYNKNVKSRYI